MTKFHLLLDYTRSLRRFNSNVGFSDQHQIVAGKLPLYH